MELMTAQTQTTARRSEGAIKFIIGIFHPIFGEDSLQTALIKGAVMGQAAAPLSGVLSVPIPPGTSVDRLCRDV